MSPGTYLEHPFPSNTWFLGAFSPRLFEENKMRQQTKYQSTTQTLDDLLLINQIPILSIEKIDQL